MRHLSKALAAITLVVFSAADLAAQADESSGFQVLKKQFIDSALSVSLRLTLLPSTLTNYSPASVSASKKAT
jgi:amino acid permease